MRSLLVLLLVPALAGCLDAESLFSNGELRNCDDPRTFTYYLGPDHSLQTELPAAGRTPGNGFDEAFLTNDLDEWAGGEKDRTWRLEGEVQFTFWTQGINTPAPIVIGGEPGEGYHFFNQFGTNRGFIESYAIEYETALPDEEIRRYDETFVLPEGGILLEPGDHLRLLLTNLVLDGEGGRGPDILWGGDMPSALTFEATCEPTPRWGLLDFQMQSVIIPAHQGLLTGGIPPTENVNYADVAFTLDPATERLAIEIQGNGANALGVEPKSDIDLVVLDAANNEVWSIGSPYTNEMGTLWWKNLDALMPPGDYRVRVNSYSGHAYQGLVTVTQEVRG